MNKRIAIIQFPGSNTERETILACKRNGLSPVEFLWNESAGYLSYFDGYIIVGGFSYEDRSRAGIIAAIDPIINQIKIESQKGKPVLGICNGAQILVESGLVPGLKNNHIGISLSENKRIRKGKVIGVGYYNAWTYLKCSSAFSECAFTNSIKSEKIICVPVAHGEGRFIIKQKLLSQLVKNNQIIFRYSNKEGEIINEFPTNPNGSIFNIAAVCNNKGNIMAIMPHPERTTNGDLIFKSMKNYINKRPTIAIKPLAIKTKIKKIKPYIINPDSINWIIDMIITDNEALTIQNALNQIGCKVSISKKIVWEFYLKENKKDVLKEIEKTGEIYNSNKEFKTKEKFKKDTISFLVHQKEDMICRSKLESLKNRFKIEKIIDLKRGVLWNIKINSGNIEPTINKILNSNILFNPLSYECYRINQTL
tara:strand:+ start:368 stop:1636 length:1269 start_codon:yes stop_codon:yes gene_type:complete